MNITAKAPADGAGAGAGAGAGGGAARPGLGAATLSTAHVVVTPGDIITAEAGYLRGHGTYVDNGNLVASVAGIVERVNKLVSVRPLQSRYVGEIGDVVVGRVVEVGAKRWKVDINARQDAVLLLSSINLTGGVQRRRTIQDQLQMREYFAENDLISADVHRFYQDGAMVLHARSLKYGKLANGQLLSVPPALVVRCKQHFVTLECGVDAILGKNGNIWLSETVPEHEKPTADASGSAGLAESVEASKKHQAARGTSKRARATLARVRNAICALKHLFIAISPATIMSVVRESERLGLEPKSLLRAVEQAMLNPDVFHTITAPARNELEARQ